MRRVILFAAFLLLLGLSTAFAASFDVQAEDVASFSTAVSISVPTTTTPPAPATGYFFRGSPKTGPRDPFVPGQLDRQPVGEDSVQSKKLEQRVKSFEEEDDDSRYHVWQTPPADSAAVPPYIVTIKSAKVFVYQNGGSGDITVGLFACPDDALPYSGSATGCDLLTKGTGRGTGDIVEIPMPPLATPFTIADTERLRLKIVNDNDDTDVDPDNDGNFNVQWGYKSIRPSRVEVVPA